MKTLSWRLFPGLKFSVAIDEGSFIAYERAKAQTPCRVFPEIKVAVAKMWDTSGALDDGSSPSCPTLEIGQ